MEIRYPENKERSAEILRLVLPLMARHEAGFHPWSYALWYEHVTGMNPALSRILEARLAAHAPLTDRDVRQLYMQHIAARDMETFERTQSRLKFLLDDTAKNAVGASEEAARFSHALEDGRSQLSHATDILSVRRVADGLIDDTQRIRIVTADLSARLAHSKQEVESLTERLEKAQSEALLDPLTGLRNRRGLDRAVEDLTGADAGLAGGVLLIVDIDRFKAINDTYGHLRGDAVIRAVARILQANIKGRDIAARLGGEEFVLLLPDTSLANASILAEQIRRAVAQTRMLDVTPGTAAREPQGGRVTVSVGIALAEEEETLAQLIERADSALYVAKQAGRDRVSLAAPPTQGRGPGSFIGEERC